MMRRMRRWPGSASTPSIIRWYSAMDCTHSPPPPLRAVNAEVDRGGRPLLALPPLVQVHRPGQLPAEIVHVGVHDIRAEASQRVQGRPLDDLDGFGFLHPHLEKREYSLLQSGATGYSYQP